MVDQKPKWVSYFKIADDVWSRVNEQALHEKRTPLDVALELGLLNENKVLQWDSSQSGLSTLKDVFFNAEPNWSLLDSQSYERCRSQACLPVTSSDGKIFWAKLSSDPTDFEIENPQAVWLLAHWSGMRKWFTAWQKRTAANPVVENANHETQLTENFRFGEKTSVAMPVSFEVPVGINLAEPNASALQNIDFGQLSIAPHGSPSALQAPAIPQGPAKSPVPPPTAPAPSLDAPFFITPSIETAQAKPIMATPPPLKKASVEKDDRGDLVLELPTAQNSFAKPLEITQSGGQSQTPPLPSSSQLEIEVPKLVFADRQPSPQTIPPVPKIAPVTPVISVAPSIPVVPVIPAVPLPAMPTASTPVLKTPPPAATPKQTPVTAPTPAAPTPIRPSGPAPKTHLHTLAFEQLEAQLNSAQNQDVLAVALMGAWQNFFDKVMVLLCQPDRVRPWWHNSQWKKDFGRSHHIPLDKPSMFKIVNDTLKPYHGFVPKSPVNDHFFDLVDGAYPEHVTIVPVIAGERIVAVILGASPLARVQNVNLERLEFFAKIFGSHLFRMLAKPKAS